MSMAMTISIDLDDYDPIPSGYELLAVGEPLEVGDMLCVRGGGWVMISPDHIAVHRIMRRPEDLPVHPIYARKVSTLWI